MLVEFSVENFMSIKDKAILSMVAGKDSLLPENKFEINGEELLRSAAIYGANASGKSNLFKALTMAVIMVRISQRRQIGEKILEVTPFKFDAESVNKPSRFEFIFIQNKIKYKYGFSANSEAIIEEYLYKYNSSKPTLIFKRENINEYKFIKKDEKILKDIQEKNIDNKLFLSTATSWNYKETEDAYSWFDKKIDTYKNYNEFAVKVIEKLKNDSDGTLRAFILKMLKKAEINISGYKIKTTHFDMKSMITQLPYEIVMQIQNNDKPVMGISENIITEHMIKDKDGQYKEYQLNVFDESDGTQSIFYFSPIIKEALEESRIIVVDEIDNSLHPLLVKFIVSIFNDPDINKNNAQLIFTTHDTNLLSLDVLRRDQIYLTDKNYESGITELYSLDEFSVRKNENIQKGYLQGRYGAIPFLGLGDDLWE